jgi:hypothetical protein
MQFGVTTKSPLILPDKAQTFQLLYHSEFEMISFPSQSYGTWSPMA